LIKQDIFVHKHLRVINWKAKKKYYIVEIDPKSNRKSQKEAKSTALTHKYMTPLTHKYMTAHFPALVLSICRECARSEQVLGRALQGRRQNAIIATKYGFTEAPFTPQYSTVQIDEAITRSLTKLQASYVDLLQVILYNMIQEFTQHH